MYFAGTIRLYTSEDEDSHLRVLIDDQWGRDGFNTIYKPGFFRGGDISGKTWDSVYSQPPMYHMAVVFISITPLCIS